MRIEILDGDAVINTIEADEAFAELHYPGAWRVAATDPTAPAPQPRHVTVGAFFDRFGPAKWGILADQSALVQAVIKDASVRKYIDLDNPDFPQGLAIVQSAGHQIDPAAIINAPVQSNERP